MEASCSQNTVQGEVAERSVPRQGKGRTQGPYRAPRHHCLTVLGFSHPECIKLLLFSALGLELVFGGCSVLLAREQNWQSPRQPPLPSLYVHPWSLLQFLLPGSCLKFLLWLNFMTIPFPPCNSIAFVF